MRIRQTRISALARAVAIAALLWSSVPALAEVDQYGSYSTGIKIDVPVFHGLEPQVSLSYSSNGGNGNVGTGWDLHAASMIKRASSGRGAPRYDTSDIFLLDGTELVPCAAGSPSPSCMTAGVSIVGTHSTKIESYKKIRYDSSNNTWVIWAKDGTSSVYSPLEQGFEWPTPVGFSNTYRWRLASVTDTHGNRVNYNYTCSLVKGSECYLDKITYGDSIACETPPPSPPDTPSFQPGQRIPGVEIKFFWQSRTDKLFYGNGRGLSEAISRLKSIRVRNAGWTNRAYVLNYINSSSSDRSILSRVQQFGSDAVICEDVGGCSGAAYGEVKPFPTPTSLPPKQFTAPAMNASANTWATDTLTSGFPFVRVSYDNSTGPFQTADTGWPVDGSSLWDANQVGMECRNGDINGDGLTDEVCMYFTGTLTSGTPHISAAIANRSGFTFTDQIMTGSTAIPKYWVLSDFTGDGKDDHATIFQGSLVVFASNGDGTFDISHRPWPSHNWPWSPWTRTGYGQSTLGWLAGVISPKWQTPPPNINAPQQWFTGDVNGDGRADFIYVYRNAITNTGSLCTALSTGNVEQYIFQPCQVGAWEWYDDLTQHSRFFPADINGDGKTDLVHIVYHPSDIEPDVPFDHTSIVVSLSRGDGQFGFFTQHGAAAWLDDAEWMPGDINGDGKTDIIQKVKHPADSVSGVEHMYTVIRISLGHSFYILVQDLGFPWWRCDGSTTTARLLVADFNGDNRSDLASAWASGDCTTAAGKASKFAVATSRTLHAAAQFDINLNFYSDIGISRDMPPRIGDFNADGKADLSVSFMYQLTPSDVAVDLRTFRAPNITDDVQNWAPTEQNGDGRADIVRTFFRNPGYTISTFLRSGVTYNRTDTLFSPGDIPGVTTPLDNPDTSRWMQADVGGGAGNVPDGKDDMVYVDHSASTLRIYTLLSLGGGNWTKKAQAFTPTTQFPTNHVARRWFSTDVDGDGRADLVHLSFHAPLQMQVNTLLSNGDGTWTWTPSSRTDPGFVAGDELHWRPADINGDGKGDLVYVRNIDATQTQLYTLLSNFAPGNTTYASVPKVVAFGFPDAHNWRAADVNGDGLSDLVYVEKYSSGGVKLNYLLSIGNGTYTPRTLGPFTPNIVPASLMAYDDVQNTKLANVNGDGKIDFVYVTSYLEATGIKTGLFSLINQYPSAAVFTQLSAWPFTYADARNWRPMDSNADGEQDLLYVSPDINSLRFDSADDLLSGHSNGLMGSASIAYKMSTDLHANLPARSLRKIVDTAAQTDAVTGGSYRTNYSYTDATWSYRERRFLGFSSTDTSDGHSTLSTIYDQSDECGSRPLSIISKDSSGKVLRQNNSIYSSLPQGALPPYKCTLAIAYDNECEGVSPCLENKTEFVRDGYGNVVETDSWGRPGRSDDRRLLTPSNFNTSAYIVGLPAYMDLYDGTGTLKASTRYVYDQPITSDWTLPPGQGELTKTLDWDSDTRRYLTTTHEYDGPGNQTLVTDPIGSYIKTSYDCNYNRYPESICNNLFCNTATWNLGRGLMSNAVDANNQTTFYDYDALSRKSKTTSPDGSFTAQYFLDYGSAIQRYRTEVSDDSTGRWAGFRWTEDYFDGLGRTYETRSEGATPIDADILFKQYTFVDASDRIFKESSVFTSAETPVWTTYSYDGLKRHIDTLLPGGRFHTYSTYLQGSEQKFDERGHMREFFHDAAGRIVKVRERHQIFENNSEGGSGAYDYYDTQYEYDANDWMTKITDSLGRTSTTDYNSLGWKLESRDWDLGISSYTYNPNGSLASEIDARNFSKEYTYDSIGRNTFTKHKDNTGSITRAITQSYDRDPTTGLTQGSSLGRLVKISDTTVKYKGCYKSPSAHYTRIGTATADTIESCVARALAGGYDFAALEFGGYCYGGFALVAPVAESECNTPCTGNSAEVCGGLGRGSVYGTWGSNTIVDASWYDKMGRPDQQQRCIDRGLGAARSCSSMMFNLRVRPPEDAHLP